LNADPNEKKALFPAAIFDDDCIGEVLAVILDSPVYQKCFLPMNLFRSQFD
jgi:hypothetical protein